MRPTIEKTHLYLYHGLYSLSGKTSYRQISWSLEAARLDVAMVVSLWNLTGTSAAALPRNLPNFRAIGKVQTQISRLRNFTRSCGKTSYRLVNRGPYSVLVDPNVSYVSALDSEGTRNCRSVMYWDTPARLQNTNDLCDLDLWPIDLDMVRDTWFPHRLYLCHIWLQSL